MLSAKVQPKKIKFENRYLYMVYDIKTSRAYKKLKGKSLMNTLMQMQNGDFDEEDFAEIIACCLRETPNGECLTLDYFEDYNPIAIINIFADDFQEQLLRGLDEKELTQKAQKAKSKDYMQKKSGYNGNKKKR